ncbi:hypothetical protein OG250_18275 [Streptomyces sp. NBC_00487]|nr:hypothetical protein OG889_19040 [Streptomyces sp. NBC_00481]
MFSVSRATVYRVLERAGSQEPSRPGRSVQLFDRSF